MAMKPNANSGKHQSEVKKAISEHKAGTGPGMFHGSNPYTVEGFNPNLHANVRKALNHPTMKPTEFTLPKLNLGNTKGQQNNG